MSYQNKTKEELIEELQELKQEHRALRASHEEDGSEKERAGKVQKAGLEAFEGLLQKVPAAVYVFRHGADGAFGFESLSKRWCEMHQTSRKEALNDAKLHERLIHQEDLQSFLAQQQAATRDHKPFLWEGRFMIRNRVRYFSIESVPQVFDNGDIRWYGVTQDITRYKEIEELGTKQQNMLAQAEELTLLGSWKWDMQEDSWTVSENWRKIHGVGEAAMKTEELLLLAHPEDRPAIRKAFDAALKSGRPYDIEHRIIKKDTGEVRHVCGKGQVTFGKNGSPTLMIGSAQDITERKKAEQALRESEEKFRTLADMAKVVIDIVADDEGSKSLYVNDEWSRVHGYTKEEAKDLKPIDLVAPDCRAQVLENAKKRAQRAPAPSNYEIKTVSKTGEIRYLDFSSTLINFDNQKAFLTTAIDITRRKHVEQALRESEEKLRELIAQKDKFFSIIAHDLKSPLSAVIGLSDLLAREIEEDDYESISMYADLIKQTSEKVMNLLTNLLQWSRGQTGTISFNPKQLDLGDMVENNISLIRISANQKNITIKKNLSQNIQVFADKAMAYTVLRNLFSNAIKFTNKGGEITISTREEEGQIIISVRDSGVGIAADRLKTLFEIGDSTSTPGTNNETGSGLGLILCKEFVEKHGGKIWAESQQEKGSVFHFTLPGESISKA